MKRELIIAVLCFIAGGYFATGLVCPKRNKAEVDNSQFKTWQICRPEPGQITNLAVDGDMVECAVTKNKRLIRRYKA